MPVINRKSHGWTLPGYKYLGPWNDLDLGEPTNQLDAAARAHDQAYTHYINKQLYPYLFFNEADENLIQQAKQHPGLAAYLTNFVFSTKKQIFPRQHATKRKGFFINKALQAKKAKTQGHKRPNTESNPDLDNQTISMAEAGDQTEAQAGNQPGGSGGGGGVGHSTGGIKNQTFFHYKDGYCYVTAYCSRHIYINQPIHEEYILTETTRPAQQTDAATTQRDNYHAQIQTPWFHLDPNAWGVWFAPSDFQRIIAEAEEIEIESYEWEICNISIKTATEVTTGQTVYNNDLIATLQVVCDADHYLPYTPEAPRGSTLNFIPWRACTLPNYRYYIETHNTVRWDHGPYEQQARASRNIGIDPNWQFFCIEHKCQIDLLRTGDTYSSGIYKFNCDPKKNLQLWQSSRHIGKPPVVEIQTTHQETQYEPSHQRGFHWGNMGIYTDARPSPNESDQIRPYDIGYQVPFWNFDATYGGPQVRNQPPSKIPYINGDPEQEMSESKIIFDYAHGQLNPGQTQQISTGDYGVIGQGQGNPGSWIQPLLSHDKVPSDTPQEEHRATSLQPVNTTNTFNTYTAFNNYSINYPWQQIWDKHPTTEYQPKFSSLATFKCKTAAPGQILLKVTPQYTNQFNENNNTNPKIDTFASFFWQGCLKIKYKIRGNRQFNPYILPRVQDGQERSGKPNYEGLINIPMFQSSTIKDIYY